MSLASSAADAPSLRIRLIQLGEAPTRRWQRAAEADATFLRAVLDCARVGGCSRPVIGVTPGDGF